jgi:hypothetical protein
MAREEKERERREEKSLVELTGKCKDEKSVQQGGIFNIQFSPFHRNVTREIKKYDRVWQFQKITIFHNFDNLCQNHKTE